MTEIEIKTIVTACKDVASLENSQGWWDCKMAQPFWKADYISLPFFFLCVYVCVCVCTECVSMCPEDKGRVQVSSYFSPYF